MYTNNSRINKADGVIIHVKKNLKHSANVETYGKLQMLNISLNLDNGLTKISGIYRCHDYPVHDFLEDFQLFLKENKHIDNHLIIGDVNIDIIEEDIDSCSYMDNLLEMSYLKSY